MKIPTKLLEFTDTTPGYALGIVKDNTLVLEKYVGLADVDCKIPISPTTAFRLASNTKPFTAMAIMLLKEKESLSFDDKLSKFFPDFPAYGKNITIRQLLSHTSGIPDHEKPLYKKIKPGEEPTIYDSLAVLKQQKITFFPPGSKYLYSDAGFIVLALIIEKVSGKRYAEFLQNEIFNPLKMKSTYVLDETKPKIPSRALGYKKLPDNYELFDYDALNYIVGDEGIYSTVRDLARWQAAWNSEVLVKKTTLDEALTQQQCTGTKKSPCGFSWFIKERNDGKRIFHDGIWVGFTNVFLMIPSKRLTIIMLSNTRNFPSTKSRVAIATNLIKELNL